MEVRFSDEVAVYAAAAEPFLGADPVANNILLTVIDEARRKSTPTWTGPVSFWWIEDGGVTVGAAHWTPPHKLWVSSLPPAAAPLLVTAVQQRARDLAIAVPGVGGPRPDADAVARAWCDVSGQVAELGYRMLVHILTAVTDPPVPPGRRRVAHPDDTGLLTEWMHVFIAETGGTGAGDRTRASLEASIELGLTHLWEVDGQPVSVAGHRIPVMGVVRVGPVYTPAPRRTQGYARRLVAELSADLLARSAISRCMLYTNAANPVSNSIYRQVGYTAKAEHVDIRFL